MVIFDSLFKSWWFLKLTPDWLPWIFKKMLRKESVAQSYWTVLHMNRWIPQKRTVTIHEELCDTKLVYLIAWCSITVEREGTFRWNQKHVHNCHAIGPNLLWFVFKKSHSLKRNKMDLCDLSRIRQLLKVKDFFFHLWRCPRLAEDFGVWPKSFTGSEWEFSTAN